MLTVIVVDEFGEGLPLLWAICNREDRSVLVQLFKKLQERTGPLKPAIFMCDDAHAAIRVGVFGVNQTRKLLTNMMNAKNHFSSKRVKVVTPLT